MSLAVATLTNMQTGETLFFQFHPETLTEQITVDWGSALPVSGSRELFHYRGTRSERIPLRLFYTSIGGVGGVAGKGTFTAGGNPHGLTPEEELDRRTAAGGDADAFGPPITPSQNQKLSAAERFLKSLCYGRSFLADYDGVPIRFRRRITPPPLVVFTWPEIVHVEGLVERLSIRYERFDPETLGPIALVADIDFVEASRNPIEGRDVRRQGSLGRATSVTLPTRVRPAGDPGNTRQQFQFTRPFRGPQPL